MHRSKNTSLNNIVGELLNMQRHIEPQCLRALEVDYRFVFGRPLHWKLASLLTL
jgi:hypothetical protein